MSGLRPSSVISPHQSSGRKEIKGDPEAWRAWWGADAKPYYFIGKDNITFHTIIWPAMLMAYDDNLALPEDVPANEFLNLEGYQLSTSRNWAVWVPEYLANYDPDALRYVLSSNMPETSDSEFTWPDYIRRVNNELVGTYGNLVHRTLTFLQRFFDGVVPDAQPDEAGEHACWRESMRPSNKQPLRSPPAASVPGLASP